MTRRFIPIMVFALSLALFAPRLANAQDTITTVAGTLISTPVAAVSASIPSPYSLAKDQAGNLFIAVPGELHVYKVDPSGVLTIAAGAGTFGPIGDGGPATNGSLNFPQGVAVDASGNLFIADSYYELLRRVDAGTGIITTVAGNGNNGFSGDGGPATSATLSLLSAVVVDGAGNLFIADQYNHRVRRVAAATGVITTVAGNGTAGFSGDGGPATSASLNGPQFLTVDSTGNLFISDEYNNRVRRVDAATGAITTVAGNGSWGFSGDGGPATSASFKFSGGLAVDGAGNLFISDINNQRIRQVAAATGIITTVAGNGTAGFSGDGGVASTASMDSPYGLLLDGLGNLFIADRGNHRVRRVDGSTGIITTVAGSGNIGDGGPATSAILAEPSGAAVDGSGNFYIGDEFNNRVRRVDAATGVITTFAGNGLVGFSGDGGAATDASLAVPGGLARISH